MLTAPIPADEPSRLADVLALRILDTPPEQRFDRITRIASLALNVPIAYVAVLDADRQWFKSRIGLPAAQTARDISFCGHTILRDEPLIIADTLKDNRFADNPQVTGPPYIRSYAGCPVKGPAGHNVATLCAADTSPRSFTESQVELLRELAAMVERELGMVDLIESQRELLITKEALVQSRQQLAEETAEAAAYVRSLLPEPLDGPLATDWVYLSSSQLGGDAFGYHWLNDHKIAVYLLDVTGHGAGAALLSISIMNVLRAGSLPKARCDDPPSILTALNRAFPMHRHHDKFFTIWYGVYDTRTRQLTYTGGGHPAALIVRPRENGQARLQRLPSQGLVVGILPDADYPCDTVRLDRGDRLYLFSDGVFEVFNGSGDMLGYDRFIELVDAGRQSVRDTLEAVRRWQGHERFADDFSLLELRVGE